MRYREVAASPAELCGSIRGVGCYTTTLWLSSVDEPAIAAEHGVESAGRDDVN
jgi:hypothetical protein